MKNKNEIFNWNFHSYIGRPRPVFSKKWPNFEDLRGGKNIKKMEFKLLKIINKSRIKLLKKNWKNKKKYTFSKKEK